MEVVTRIFRPRYRSSISLCRRTWVTPTSLSRRRSCTLLKRCQSLTAYFVRACHGWSHSLRIGKCSTGRTALSRRVPSTLRVAEYGRRSRSRVASSGGLSDVPVNEYTGKVGEVVRNFSRAQLFRCHDGEWKEQGLGNAMLLLHKQCSKACFLMQQEITMKIVCAFNVEVDSGYCNFLEYADNAHAWLWLALDRFEGEHQVQELALRFLSTEFREVYEYVAVLRHELHCQTGTWCAGSVVRRLRCAGAVHHQGGERPCEHTSLASLATNLRRLCQCFMEVRSGSGGVVFRRDEIPVNSELWEV